ncbi:MAG: isochorismatase [Gammaproteobacteria bacterium RIFCSPHIGHO2_12_FULL_35_23]|nr:MAG: isochorismatase [Gammaproteobacteria bacterium RIFCSPHIGHO2_12_FULL_35_23]
MTVALLLIDIQRDYFSGGKMELVGAFEASLQAKEVLSRFRKQKKLIIHIQHISTRPDASFFLPNTSGIEIHQNVEPLQDEEVIIKHSPNSFKETNLLTILNKQQVNSLVIAGMMTHMCVDSTTRAAFDLGFQCTVLQDACATRALTFSGKEISADNVHQAFLAALSVPFARILPVEEFLGFINKEN